MESFFDNRFQFLKRFDLKAQGKPQKKKKWLLSRQYLQPLTEPDDEDSAQDQDDSPMSYKKKLKCAYEAAKYGMKEGVLTGIFLGGCWGIFKHLGETFTVTFQSSNGFGDKHGGGKKATVLPTQESPTVLERHSQKRTSVGSATSSERSANRTPRGSDSYQENIAGYKKSGSMVRGKSNENSYNMTSTDRLIYKLTNSKLPIRCENQYSPLRSAGAGVYKSNRFVFRKSEEKVQIVGYAFIQTTGSIIDDKSGSGSIKSNESDSPKNTGSLTGNDDARKSSEEKSNMTIKESSNSGRQTESEPESITASDEKTSLLSERNSIRSADQSIKSASSSAKSSRQSIRHTVGSSNEKFTKSSSRSSGLAAISNGGLIRSQTSERGTEQSRSTLPGVLEETQNITPVSSDLSGRVKIGFQHRISEDSDSQMDNPQEHSIDKQDSNISGISSINYSNSSYQEMSKVIQTKTPNATDNYMGKSRKQATGFPNSENIYPDPKKTGSILVNADSLSNGFTSPQYLRSAEKNTGHSREDQSESQTSSMSSPERPSVASDVSELRFKSINHIVSASMASAISRTDAGNQSRYEIESSPKFNRSFVNGKKDDEMYRAESNLTHDRSYVGSSQYRKYNVETSPMYYGSGTDAKHKKETSPAFKRSSLSEAQEEKGHSPKESFTSNRSYVSERQEGKFKSDASPLNNRSYVSETQDARSYRSYASENQDEGEFLLKSSPTYTESYVNGTPDDWIYGAESNASHNRSYVSATENLERSTRSSRRAGSFFNGRSRDLIGASTGYVKSYVSATQNQDRYSAGSAAYSKSAFEEIEPAMAKSEYSASLYKEKPSKSSKEFRTNSYMGRQREVSAAAMSARSAVSDATNGGGFMSPPTKPVIEKHDRSVAVQKKEEKPSHGFGFLSAVNESIIVLSACNCAIVLGVICSVISTTRASLAV